MREKGKKGYDREFKIGAVKLVTEEGKPVREVAKELGISDKSLYNWVSELKKDSANAFPGSGHLKGPDEELKRLREENRILRMERDLLKKTLPLFMQDRR